MTGGPHRQPVRGVEYKGEPLDAAAVGVVPGNVVPGPGEGGGERQADVPEAGDSELHGGQSRCQPRRDRFSDDL